MPLRGKVVITCAVTGSIHTPTMSPHLPLTPDEIARDAIAAAEAGAAILHLHARDPKDGRPTPDPDVFMQFLPRIKQSTGAVVNITTGGGHGMSLEERLAAPLCAKPEMCSLNMGSMNFGLFPLLEKYKEFKYPWESRHLEMTRDFIFRNTFADIERILKDLGEGCGTRFEFECYDVGHLYNLAHFLDRGLVKPPLFVQTIFGILGGIGADPENVVHMKRIADKLFGDSYAWSVLAAGRHQLPLGVDGCDHGRQCPRRARGFAVDRQRKARREQCRPGQLRPVDYREPVARNCYPRRGAGDACAEGRRRGRVLMIDKRVKSLAEAVAGIADGATILCAGFGGAGLPDALCEAVVEQGARDLTVVANNAGTGRRGLAALLAAGRVRRIICSFPRSAGSVVFEELYAAGRIELQLVPQGIISERMRCAAAGLGGFYSPVSVGTRLADGKEHHEIDGRIYVLEKPLKGDVALLSADRGDRWGNLTYRKSARNFNPTMAMAADLSVVQVRRIVELGELDPEMIVTPGIFIDRLVEVAF